jgi:TonB dependent receptor
MSLAGSGNLNTGYAAMASVPGVNVPQNQQGWYQPVYIRGGDLDQVGWEFDGIPANRSYDNAPQTFISSLGQQELQVYTGGTLPSADASGIAGYVNQVVKRGTLPGFGDVTYGIGSPAYYGKVSAEAGGATPDQNFSWYAGVLAADTDYRYINNSNGAGSPGYFYPLDTSVFFNENHGLNVFDPGNTYGIAETQDRENVINLHFGVPHQNGSGKDDIQTLWMTGYILMPYYSSINDLGGPSEVSANTVSEPLSFSDGDVYNGSIFGAPNPADVTPYLYPSTPHYPNAIIPSNLRDTNVNNVSISKLQYQRNFSSTSFLRIFGYTLYSDWIIHGPVSSALYCCYGAEIADYELPSHTTGGVADYQNQLDDKNLLTASAFYNQIHIQRYTTTHGFPGVSLDGYNFSAGYGITNDIDAAGNCYGPGDTITTCFGSPEISAFSANPAQGTFAPWAGPGNPYAPTTLGELEPFAAAPGTHWAVTENGYSYNLNKVEPIFDAFSLNDNYRPTEKLNLNIGARFEDYTIVLDDNTVDGYPARQFWFNAYNREFCFGPGYFQPLWKGPTGTCAADFPLSTNEDLVNTNPHDFSHSVTEPRVAASYELNSDNVLRLSAGLYARPGSTREASWNTGQENLPSFLGQNFAQYGLNTPNHDLVPDESTNFDLSFEHHFAGTDASFKITPFYRSTEHQYQQLVVNAISQLFGGLNTGHLTSYGTEFAFNKGDFDRNGWAFVLSYTYNHSMISYDDFASGRNVIDLMNQYIQMYNSYTKACAAAAPSSSPTALCGVFGNLNAVAGNQYYNQAVQPLFAHSGVYVPYDLIPVPYAAANGYEVPDVASFVLNYKHDKWNVTPTVAYSSGTTYGSPLSWPGIAPGLANVGTPAISPGCTAVATVESQSCGVPLMIPDPYTGKFDNFGAFNEPWRVTVNTSIGYQFTSNVTGTVSLLNLVDTCHQRGYPWDAPNVCLYSSLPSFFLQPTGGTLAQAAAGPPQLRYPYGEWLNDNNTGFVGVTAPLQATFEVTWKM